MNYKEKAIKLHKELKGKIEIKSKVSLKNLNDLSLIYTPGVGEVTRAIKKSPFKSFDLTGRGNTIAILTNASAILGLGDVGAEAGLPVMEGKSVIFKEFADLNAIPLCINCSRVNDLVKFALQIEPNYAAINLEDVKAPDCFSVLEKLEKRLSIPVFHDDKDGTAIAVLAGLINIAKLKKKSLKNLKIIINGAGAAGIGISELLIAYGVSDIILLDSKGIISQERKDLNKYKRKIARKTNLNNLRGNLAKALKGGDVFIGVSKGKILKKSWIKNMNPGPIIFALANPTPEILPEEAQKAGAFIVGTGRSDYPNQINNALVFPGIFKAIIENKIKKLDNILKIEAAQSIANTLKQPSRDNILPGVLDRRVVSRIVKDLKK